MTAIKPIDDRRVTAVASERYPLNQTCSYPDCHEPAVDPHHAFPRSAIGGSSWFVLIEETGQIIPHVTGVCRAHHDQYEARELWLRWNVEDDGIWTVWYRNDGKDEVGNEIWAEVGALNPQPGSVDGKPKSRPRLKGKERRQRRTISIKVPNDTENGGELWDEMLTDVKERLYAKGAFAKDAPIPNYEALMAVAHDWLTTP